MEKSVALFYCKNISKKFEKVCKNLLTNAKRCVIIVSQSKRKAQKRKNEVKKMKKYVITCEDTYNTLHKNVGGCAYVAIAFGTHNELAKYIKENKIDMNELA